MSDTLAWIAGATQAITAVVAVAALAVSIYNLYLQRRDKSPQLRVRGSIANLMDADFSPIEHVYMITVVNHSTAPLTVTQLYIWHGPDRKLTVPNMRGEKPLPCKLDPWEGASWWVGYEELRERLRQEGHRGRVRIKLEATDGTGRSHHARSALILNARWWEFWR